MTRILIYNTQRDLPFSKTQMKRAILFLITDLEIATDEVSFHFVCEKEISRLHKKFFNDPSPTDCITLPLDPPETEKGSCHILGEAFICPKTALLYARTHAIDPCEELYRYVIHCLLHFLGYTDGSSRERARMKKKESSSLKKVLFSLKQKPT